MSTHSVRVVRIGSVDPRPNAESLGITQVFGYTCCVLSSNELARISAG